MRAVVRQKFLPRQYQEKNNTSMFVLVFKILFLLSKCLGSPHASYPGGGGGGVLRISSDGDDRRIFLGLKFSIPGLF